jgi:hypothetical protein
MLGRPLAVVGFSRMVLLPAFTDTLNVLVTQLDQAPVPSNDGVCTADPLTIKLAGRAVVVPLANRTPNVAVPAVDAFTVNCAAAPTALVPLQNPDPENPAQLESMVPVQVAGELSASYRVGAATAVDAGHTRTAPATTAVPAMSDVSLRLVPRIVSGTANLPLMYVQGSTHQPG